jgi:diaminopimelate decarboxylase
VTPFPHSLLPIGYFNIESEPEFEAIARVARELGVRTRAALRINPDVDPRTHAYTATGTKSSKFGGTSSGRSRSSSGTGATEF